MSALGGLFFIIPVSVLVTISYFVLFTARKADSEGLKTFGRVTAVLLWISAGVIFSAGAYSAIKGDPLGTPLMQHKGYGSGGLQGMSECQMMKQCMQRQMMQGYPQGQEMPGGARGQGMQGRMGREGMQRSQMQMPRGGEGASEMPPPPPRQKQ